MKYLITALIIFMVPLVGLSNDYQMKCSPVARGINRCENKEVICYVTRTDFNFFRCKFKDTISLENSKECKLLRETINIKGMFNRKEEKLIRLMCNL